MQQSDKPPAIFLMGPTASGKTDLAIELCQKLPCEIISVDSALVYRGLDIGSAKPSREELEKAPHRLIDICDPAEAYSAAEFRKDALEAMAEITASGKIPLLVGGTMLYFKALLEGIADMPETDLAIRKNINADAAAHGWPSIHAQLAEVDPVSAARIHPNHSQRIERALAVYLDSGITMTEYREREKLARDNNLNTDFAFQTIQLAIAPVERSVLHRRIEKRFLQMMEQGLVDEVRNLHERPELHLDLPSMRAVGYRQVWQYLDGDLTKEEMINRGVIATRQLAKRQFTWLKGWQDLHWLLTDGDGNLVDQPLSDGVNFTFEGERPIHLALKYIDKLIM